MQKKKAGAELGKTISVCHREAGGNCSPPLQVSSVLFAGNARCLVGKISSLQY